MEVAALCEAQRESSDHYKPSTDSRSWTETSSSAARSTHQKSADLGPAEHALAHDASAEQSTYLFLTGSAKVRVDYVALSVPSHPR